VPQNPQTSKDPYEALFDDLSEGLTEPSPTGGLSYKGFLTPFPESWLPDFIKDGYNNSLEGLYEQISTGQKAFDIDENYDPNFLEDIGATVISFSQPADMLALGLGGGFGGLALKATTKQAATALVKSGMKKELAKVAAQKGAQQLAKKLAFDKKAVVKLTAGKQAGALGFYSFLQNAEVQKISKGDIDWMESLESGAKGYALGGITGAIGGKIATTGLSPKGPLGGLLSPQMAARIPAETFAFGTISPLLEGSMVSGEGGPRMPRPSDYAHAAGLIFSLAGTGVLKKKAINEPWAKTKNYIKGEVKKRTLSIEELQKQAESKAQQEIGGDIWSNGESEVKILKDFTNSDKIHVLELKNLKDGSVFSEGKTDFFKGRKNEAGERISKPYKRLSVAGEPLSFKKNATGTDITNTLKKKIFGLKKRLKISDVEFKNMVDDMLGTKDSKAEYDGKRLKSGLSKKEFDTQLHNRLLNDLTVKERAAAIKKDIVKLGGNEVYYLDSPLKENYPKIYKALQRVGAGVETAKFQLSKHPIGRKMASRMINTDASIGALTGKYLTMMESVEIGGRHIGTRRKKTFFDMTESQAKELAKDLERPVPQLPYTLKIKKLFDIMYSIAEQSGMPIRDKINNYFPHVIKEGVLRNLQKDVDKMINIEQVLAKNNLANEQGVNVLLERMIKAGEISGDITSETLQALNHLRNKLGSYSSAFESLRTGINSERYTINKHLEKGRELDLPEPLLERDARVVIPDYIQRWAKRVEYVKSFGVEGEKMFGDINTLQASGFSNEARVLRETFDSFTNLSETNPARNYRRSTKGFWNGMVNFGIATKIGAGFATLPNLGQPFISSMLKAGVPRTIYGMFKYATNPEYRKFIKESGAMATSLSVHQLISGYQPSSLTKTGKIAEWMTRYFGLTIPYLTFEGPSLKAVQKKPWQYLTKRIKGQPIITFQAVNRNNQIISAVSGYEAMKVWRKWAKGEGVGGNMDFIPGISNRLRSVENLNQMGLVENYEQYKRDLTSGKITEKEFFKRVNRDLDKELSSETRQREAIYRFAIDSQLQRNILREPVYFNDPRFRPFVLFKRFGYRQFEWIYKNTLQEVKAGNALYVLRMMAGGLVYGPLLNSAKRMYRDALAGEPIFDDEYSVTEVIEDYDNVKKEMDEKGYSVNTFLDAAQKNISMGDLMDSFAAIGAFGFVGDITSAMYEGEQKMIRAGEFLLKPAVLQDMMVGVDTATRFLKDYGDYGFKNSVARVPKTLSPAFGTVARQLTTRAWTPGQRETYDKYRRGQIKSEMLDAFLDGDEQRALRLFTAWNRANPERPFSYNDISWKAMWDKAERKAKKRSNP
tara:strand:+ start:3935 stop:7948 length:4014 start_codon:yes stop_codon:yes gene_type:complete